MSLVVMLVGPSGVGKNTVIETYSKVSKFAQRIACTTRKKRDYEKDGVHYHFLSPGEFLARVKSGEFVEWACVHKKFYGTPKSEFDKALESGMDVIFDLDFQGAEQIKRKMPKSVTIFLLPPNLDELARRLEKRKSGETEREKLIRFATARREILEASNFDFWLVNDDLDGTVLKIQKLLGIISLGKTPPSTVYRNPDVINSLVKAL